MTAPEVFVTLPEAGPAAGGSAAASASAPAPADPEQFTAWVQPHWQGMAVLARRLVSGPDWEDVVQESLMAAWRSRASFDPSRGSARNWLLTVTANRARTSLARVIPLPVADVADLPGPVSTLDSDADLSQAIDLLPERQRLAVSLFYFVGLPVADVAAVMDCSEGTVKSTLSDARRNLRNRLGADYR